MREPRRAGHYDNSVVETFFKTINAETLWRRSWPTRRETEVAIFQYINGFYNPHRRHSALGWESPVASTESGLNEHMGRHENGTGTRITQSFQRPNVREFVRPTSTAFTNPKASESARVYRVKGRVLTNIISLGRNSNFSASFKLRTFEKSK